MCAHSVKVRAKREGREIHGMNMRERERERDRETVSFLMLDCEFISVEGHS